MTPTEAVKTIEQALNAATLKGVFTLADTNQVLVALNVIHGIVPVEPTLEVVEE